jgi:hypothetical protein
MRTRLVVLSLAVLGVTGATLALAATKTISDKKGDAVKGYADIKAATFSDTAHTLVFKVTTYNTFKTANAPCVSISAPKKHPPGDRFVICGDGKIGDFQHGSTAGKAKVGRPNQSTVVYRIPRRVLGGDKVIGWAIQVRAAPCRDLCDQAPEGPGTHIVQKL